MKKIFYSFLAVVLFINFDVANAKSYIIKLNRSETPSEFFSRTGYTGRVLDENTSSRTIEIFVPTRVGISSRALGLSLKGVDYIEENKYYTLQFGSPKPPPPSDPAAGDPANNTPELSFNDTHTSKLWALRGVEQPGSIRATHAKYYLRNRRLSEVVVGVLDTGVEFVQEDLKSRLIAGRIDGEMVRGVNGIEREALPVDDHSHGTHVAATIAAQVNNSKGIAGVAPNARIFPMRFLSASGSGSLADAIYAMDKAYQVEDIKIMNHSWGGQGRSRALEEAFERGRERGILMVVAAGNDKKNNDRVYFEPANIPLDNVISVAAIDNEAQMARFSNYGRNKVHIAAPGVSIFSALHADEASYDWKSGTSMAAPHVSGVAAIIWGLRPEWSYGQVRSHILNNARRLNSLEGKVSTGGTLDLFRAVKDL